MIRRLLRKRITDRERGAALITVIGISALVMGLLATSIVVVIHGARYARDDADWNGALAAAYAGVEEYQSRLAENPDYVRFGNPAAEFSDGSTLLEDRSNPALGFDADWGTVPGSSIGGGEPRASFRYEVDASSYYTEGILRLRSTGRVGEETRSIVADLRQSGFVHYLYFTDMEIQDPALNGYGSSCYRYAWSSPARPSSCGTIHFANNDVINGQVHSNDIIYACGATFKGAVTTAWNPPSGNRHRCTTSGGAASFEIRDPQRGNTASYLPVLAMPETNSEIRTVAVTDGCVYTGPTSVRLRSDGMMVVRSPLTKHTRPGAPVSRPSACGTPGTSSGQLGHVNGAVVPVPDGGAVYVQNVPTSTSDPNYRKRPDRGCNSGNDVGYPVSGERAPSAVDGVAPYDCQSGDLFVEGTFNGQATLAAENFVYIVDDVRYADRDDDLLGLIGNNMIYAWNPAMQRGSSHNYRPESPDVTIEAALLSLRSFAVQNTGVAGHQNGTLTVRGSIAQAFRGIVKEYSGYDKDYQYDPRLRFRSPPHFLSPVTSAYGVSTWIETEAAFDAAGDPR
jgi:hypothetical protein